MSNKINQYKKVYLGKSKIAGRGISAVENIKKGKIVFDFSDGKIYEAEKCSDLQKIVADHAIQFAEHKWIDTQGLGRFLNHSCEPNCGIRGKFKVVAMRNIKRGEELTWDYEMTEDSDWRMECHCGSSSCRKIIGEYKNMPESTREKYNGYISEWLINKYGK